MLKCLSRSLASAPRLPRRTGSISSDDGSRTCSRCSHANLANATTHAPTLAESIPASEYHTSMFCPYEMGPCGTAAHKVLKLARLQLELNFAFTAHQRLPSN